MNSSNPCNTRSRYRWVIIGAMFLMVFICLGFCSSNKGLYLSAITEALDIKRSLFSVNDSCANGCTFRTGIVKITIPEGYTVDEVIELDAQNRAAMSEANDLRANRNKVSVMDYNLSATQRGWMGASLGKNDILILKSITHNPGGDSKAEFQVYRIAEGESAASYMHLKASEIGENSKLEHIGNASCTFIGGDLKLDGVDYKFVKLESVLALVED